MRKIPRPQIGMAPMSRRKNTEREAWTENRLPFVHVWPMANCGSFHGFDPSTSCSAMIAQIFPHLSHIRRSACRTNLKQGPCSGIQDNERARYRPDRGCSDPSGAPGFSGTCNIRQISDRARKTVFTPAQKGRSRHQTGPVCNSAHPSCRGGNYLRGAGLALNSRSPDHSINPGSPGRHPVGSEPPPSVLYVPCITQICF